MVGSMPYSLEKGPYFSVIEDFANSDATRLAQTLQHLRDDGDLTALTALSSPTLDEGPLTPSEMADHINEHWFGKRADPNNQGQWLPQGPFNGVTNPQTGFWTGWYGNCEDVLRETLIRACEVSLGLDHDEDPGRGPTPRHWPIEFFWRCPLPWFEGWVTWRQTSAVPKGGQVTVVISTPGHGHPLRNSPLYPPPQGAGYAVNPVAAHGTQGMWVVSQQYHRPRVTITSEESGLGEYRFPTLGLAHASEGPVLVVAPAEVKGGVLAPPRKWQPPT